MLMLLFYVGNDLYAIESSHVVEVIPRVPLRTVHHAPDYVAGLFNYRGKIVSVIDLCYLISNKSSRLCLSTRMIIVSYPNQDNELQYLGLIAEKITETLNQPKTAFVDAGVRIQAPYLGGMLINEKGIIQRIHVEKLFANLEDGYLLTAGENDINELARN